MLLNGSSLDRTIGASNLPPDEVLFGRTQAMRSVQRTAAKVCQTNTPILIEGKSGTGKELLARWIHAHSAFSTGEFVKVNCAAIPGALLESELFGYERGAFTGAYSSKPGRVELAHNGTLFLDEIVDLDLSFQAKLLQFLQDGCFTRIGNHVEQCVETRVICSASRPLGEEIEKGRFRSDLFYRINVIEIHMPSLHERRDDIVSLAEYFRRQFQGLFGKETEPFPREMLECLRTLEWPGNIRELENRVARYVIMGADDDPTFQPTLRRRSFVRRVDAASGGPFLLKRITKEAVKEVERNLILSVLQANHWNRQRAAEVLKISYRALIYKMREAGLSSRWQSDGERFFSPTSDAAMSGQKGRHRRAVSKDTSSAT